jgi:hypothetical protein
MKVRCRIILRIYIDLYSIKKYKYWLFYNIGQYLNNSISLFCLLKNSNLKF